MKDPDLIRLNKTVTGLTAMILDLMYSDIATRRVLKDLMPTLTAAQQDIIRRLHTYKEEAKETALINLENSNPRLAAILSEFLAGGRPL